MEKVDSTLKKYIKKAILPCYQNFSSHNISHIKKVTRVSQQIASGYPQANPNMVYTVAAFHDIGVSSGRGEHEQESAKLLRSDKFLQCFFSTDEMEMMAQAVEDHRGSRKEKPRSIYGCIVSDADRDYCMKTLAVRQTYTGIKNFPQLTTFAQHFQRNYAYTTARLNGKDEFNMWTNCAKRMHRRDRFTDLFLQKEKVRKIYYKAWKKITKGKTLEQVRQEILDY